MGEFDDQLRVARESHAKQQEILRANAVIQEQRKAAKTAQALRVAKFAGAIAYGLSHKDPPEQPTRQLIAYKNEWTKRRMFSPSKKIEHSRLISEGWDLATNMDRAFTSDVGSYETTSSLKGLLLASTGKIYSYAVKVDATGYRADSTPPPVPYSIRVTEGSETDWEYIHEVQLSGETAIADKLIRIGLRSYNLSDIESELANLAIRHDLTV